MRIRPDAQGVTTIVMTINGRDGPNTLEFVEDGKKAGISSVIDNVGVYEWKSNTLCGFKEI